MCAYNWFYFWFSFLLLTLQAHFFFKSCWKRVPWNHHKFIPLFSLVPYNPCPCLCVCLVFLCIYVLGAHSICLLRAIDGFQAALEIKPSCQGLSLNQQWLSEQQYLVHAYSCREIQWDHDFGHSTSQSTNISFREEQPICGLNRVFVVMCLWHVSSTLTAQSALLSPLLLFL